MCYRSRLFSARGSGYELERRFSRFVKITRSTSRYAVQGHLKVTDFSTNRKLIHDLLLVINTNLPPILHRFHVTVKFTLASGDCLTLTLSLGVIPANIAVIYRKKLDSVAYIFAAESMDSLY